MQKIIDTVASFTAKLVKVILTTLLGLLQLAFLLGILVGLVYGVAYGGKFIIEYFSIDKDTFFMYVLFYPSIAVTLLFCYAMGSE